MRFMQFEKDGGKDSNVDAFYLIEIKSLFSVVLLKFNKGSREAFHTHAFNAITWFLPGADIREYEKRKRVRGFSVFRDFKGSFKPKFTPRDLLHKIYANKTSYALSFRGPWVKTWYDVIDNKKITYTWGRKIIKEEEF